MIAGWWRYKLVCTRWFDPKVLNGLTGRCVENANNNITD